MVCVYRDSVVKYFAEIVQCINILQTLLCPLSIIAFINIATCCYKTIGL